MKNQTNKKLLLSLMLYNLSFAAFGLSSFANLSQSEIQANKPIQLGYGHAPHPPEIQANKSIQLGYGHAPHPLE